MIQKEKLLRAVKAWKDAEPAIVVRRKRCLAATNKRIGIRRAPQTCIAAKLEDIRPGVDSLQGLDVCLKIYLVSCQIGEITIQSDPNTYTMKMAPSNRIIIDTDPGVDDIIAILLALTAKPEELEILLLSISYGNVEVQRCLKNVVALFHVVEQELQWRRERCQIEGFNTMKTFRPIVAAGPSHALEDETLAADNFHGADGLGGVHTSHPHFSPSDAWELLFTRLPRDASPAELSKPSELGGLPRCFTATQNPAHREILRVLRENPKDSITIVAIGPLTNLALAAAEDPETFLMAKEVVVMGGAIEHEGNIMPVAEFNTYADPIAAARVFALTSPNPSSTMPPPSAHVGNLQPYPANLSRKLNLTLFPLDTTAPHLLTRSLFDAKIAPLVRAGSPLAEWMSVFMGKTFDKISSLLVGNIDPGLSLHDPLCIWYILTRSSSTWTLSPNGPEDIRVETAGQWTRGMHVIDRRNRRRAGSGDEIEGDQFGWRSTKKGNRIYRIVDSPCVDSFGKSILEQIFG